jgi:broad specificity phosphatase PhoE
LIHEKFQCDFYLIRHGESTSNATPGIAAGANYDSHLTDRGVEQARLLGRRLASEGVRFDRVYSSTLVRSIQTTEAMLEAMGEAGRRFDRIDALMEQQTPAWRGKSIEEVFTPETLAYIGSKGMDFVPPDGESYRTVQRRVSSWLEDEIVFNQRLVSEEQSLTVAIVSHGVASKCLLHYVMRFDAAFIRRITIDNCSISRLLFGRDGWSVFSLNDASHLR